MWNTDSERRNTILYQLKSLTGPREHGELSYYASEGPLLTIINAGN